MTRERYEQIVADLSEHGIEAVLAEYLSDSWAKGLEGREVLRAVCAAAFDPLSDEDYRALCEQLVPNELEWSVYEDEKEEEKQ